MASEVKSQAISGVPAGRETLIETVYPSIASAGIGRLIGSICTSLPIRIAGVPLSCLLFALPLTPLALVGYFLIKVTGPKYIVTNRSVRSEQAIGQKRLSQTSLNDIAEVAVDVQPGQAFYHAGDVLLLNAQGNVLATLPGVSRPERLRRVILEARESRVRNDASLKAIQSRATA